MQTFGFQQRAGQLRTEVRTWQLLVGFEALAFITVTFFIQGWLKWVFLALVPAFPLLLFGLVPRPLRRRHALTETTLTLVGGYWSTFEIPRGSILAAEPYTLPLPRGIGPVTTTYHPETDTLFLLPDRTNLIKITLKEPALGKVRRQGVVEFTHVICLVDEPEAFLAALALPEPAPPAAVAVPAQPAQLRPTFSAAAAAGPSAIALTGLTKRFGDFVAVDQLTLQVKPGEIFAFLGSNGAGKSTTMRMMVGLLRPSAGQVLIGGQDPWQDLTCRRQVGYVPDNPLLYENLTALEHLWLVGGLYGLPEREVRSRAADLLEQVGLQRHERQPVGPVVLAGYEAQAFDRGGPDPPPRGSPIR